MFFNCNGLNNAKNDVKWKKIKILGAVNFEKNRNWTG